MSERDKENDPFGPPLESTRVSCLHCGNEYDSALIEWRIVEQRGGGCGGFWCCPMPGCDGVGFGFDILPVDPDWRDGRGGWVWCGDEEDPPDGTDGSESLA